MSTPKRKCLHFDEILIIGCTGSCQNDNFQCSQWWKFSQNDDIYVSVYIIVTGCIESGQTSFRTASDENFVKMTKFLSQYPCSTFEIVALFAIPGYEWPYYNETIFNHKEYSALSIYHGHIFLKISLKTPHSSPMTASYGVSFLNAKSSRSRMYDCNCCSMCIIVL